MKLNNKTDAELKRGQSRYEAASQWSGAAIVLGLLIEAWLAVEFRPVGESLIQTWGPVFADALIALGVFFEILFGRWALQHAGELQQRAEKALAEATERAGNAIERAAAAELQTEKLRKEFAWRRLSIETIKSIAETLSELPKMSLIITFTGNDPEANTFARDIGAVFSTSGWHVGFTSAAFTEVTFGVIVAQPDVPENTEACAAVRIAFSKAGIRYLGGVIPSWFMGTTWTEGGGPATIDLAPITPGDSAGPTILSRAQIYVGPRPMPESA